MMTSGSAGPSSLRTLAAGLGLVAATTALAGCDPQSGGQIGGEKVLVGCLPVETQVLSLDERSPLGFSGADALPAIAGSWERTLVWAKGGETELTVAVTHTASQVKWHDREWVNDDGSVAQPAADLGECVDVLELVVSIDFATADGAFDETWMGTVLAETPTFATHFHEIDLEALGGSYQVPEEDAAQYVDIRGSVDMAFEDGWVEGTVQAQGTRPEGDDGPDGTVSNTLIQIGTF